MWRKKTVKNISIKIYISQAKENDNLFAGKEGKFCHSLAEKEGEFFQSIFEKDCKFCHSENSPA